jgi:hypothetical protein
MSRACGGGVCLMLCCPGRVEVVSDGLAS